MTLRSDRGSRWKTCGLLVFLACLHASSWGQNVSNATGSIAGVYGPMNDRSASNAGSSLSTVGPSSRSTDELIMFQEITFAQASLSMSANAFNFSDPSQFTAAPVMGLLRASGSSLRFHWFNAIDVAHQLFVNGQFVAWVPAFESEFTLLGLTAMTPYFLVLVDPTAPTNVQIMSTSTPGPSRPSPPTDLALVAVSGGYVDLQLVLPTNDGGVPLTSTLNCTVGTVFDVLFLQTSFDTILAVPFQGPALPNDRARLNASTPQLQIFARLYGLNASTVYSLACSVQNVAGVASPMSSVPLAFMTTEAVPPSRCGPPTLRFITGGSITLALTPPQDAGGSQFLLYRVYISTPFLPPMEIATTPDTTLTLYQAGPGVPFQSNGSYTFQVFAENNAGVCFAPGDVSMLSPPLQIASFPAPSLPPSIPPPYVSSIGGSALSFQLLLPDDMYGVTAVYGFAVRCTSTVDGAVAASFYQPVVGFESYRFSVAYLRALTSYQVTVSLDTNLGQTRFSHSVMATTGPGDPPDAPTNVTVVHVGATSVDIVWQLPLETGGGVIQAYKLVVVASPPAYTPFAPRGFQPVVVNVTAGGVPTHISRLATTTSYNGSIVVQNEFGLISHAGVSFQFTTTNATLPSPPTGLFVYLSTGGMLYFSWSPCDDSGGGDNVLQYFVDLVNGTTLCSNTTTYCTATGLNASTTYKATVRAQNALGSTPPSPPRTFVTTLPTTPAAIQNLTATVVTGGSITLAWTPPVDDGGIRNVSYVVLRNNMTMVTTTTSTTATDCGLGYGQTYTYSVVAQNPVGSGSPSAPLAVTTGLIQAPSPPTLAVVTATSRSMNIQLTPACDNGGSPVLQYAYVVASVKASSMAVASFPPMPLNWSSVPNVFSITGLAPNQTYRVVVWAANLAGSSVLARLDVPTNSGIPPLVNLTLGKAYEFALDVVVWPPPMFLEPISYLLKITNNATTTTWQVVNASVMLTPFRVTIPNLTPLTAYTIEITGQGGVASGPPSNGTFSTLPNQPGFPAILGSVYRIVNGSTNVTLVVNRINGTLGTLKVPFQIATTPTMYANCTCPVDCVCDFSTQKPAVATTLPLLTFNALNTTRNIVLRTWNGQVVDQVPHVLNVSLVNVSGVAGQNLACQVLLFGTQGSIVPTSPSYAVLDTQRSFQLPLLRSGGVSGYVSVTPISVVPLNVPPYLYAQTPIPFTWTQQIVFQPLQTNGSFTINNIQPSPTYQATDRTFQILFATNSTTPNTTTVFYVTVAILDDPLVVKPPLQVNGLVRQRLTASVVSFAWTAPYYPLAMNYTYLISLGGPYNTYMIDPATINWTNQTLGATPQATLYNLVPNSYYFFEVAAVNSAGPGQGTPPQLFITSSPGPASAPFGFSVSQITGGAMTVSWNPPNDTSLLPVSSYTAQLFLGQSTIATVATTTPWYTFLGLQASTTYTVAVGANTMFQAQMFASVTATTVVNGTRPTPPSAPLLQRASGGSLTLMVVPTLDTGGFPLLNATVFIRPAGSSLFAVACLTLPNSTCTVYGLKLSTSYDIAATVANQVGSSLMGQVVSYSTTAMTVPSAPLNPMSTQVSATFLSLQWAPPLDFGGTPFLVGYQIQMQTFVPELNAFTPPVVAYESSSGERVTQATIMQLRPSTTYLLTVVALNPVSPCVAPATYANGSFGRITTTPPTSPQTPMNVQTVAVSGSSATVAWSPPWDNGGSPIVGYRIYFNGTANPTVTQTTMFTQYNLLATTVYTFTVTTLTSVGESLPSGVVHAMTSSVSPPWPPSNLTQVGFAGGTLALRWLPPLDNGGALVFAYNIYRNGQLQASISANAGLSYVDASGLQVNQTYLYTVTALNIRFEGSPATLVGATSALPDRPNPPLLSIATVTGGMVIINISTSGVFLGGTTLQGVMLTLLDTNRSVLQQVSVGPGVASQSLFGLVGATSYLVQGQTATSFGLSGPSSPVAFTTLMASIPSAPLTPVLIAVTGGTATLQLAAPLDQGGGPVQVVLNHRTLATDAFERLFFSVPTTLSVVIKSLLATSAHQFWTTAVNAAGESSSTSPLVVVTSNVTVPEQIVGPITLTSITYSTLSFAWSPVADTGGDTSVSYVVGIGSPPTYATTSDPSYTFTGLSTNSVYNVTVAAVNSVGIGPPKTTVATTDTATAGVLQFATTTVSVVEDVGVLVLSVVRTAGTANEVSISFGATSGTATSPDVYALVGSTSLVTFPDGVVAATISVQITRSPVYNAPRTFLVTLATPTDGATLGPNATCTVTIVDAGDDGQISFASANYSLVETNTAASIALVRSPNSTSGTVVVVPYLVNPAQSSTVLRFTSTAVTFADGQTSATLVVAAVRNNIFDFPDRTATIGLSIRSDSHGAIGVQGTAVVHVVDNVDVSPPSDAGAVPLLLNATGGLVIVQVAPPWNTGGMTMALVSYTMTMMAAPPSNLVLARQIQSTPLFTFSGLQFATTYAFSSTVTNQAGLVSSGSGPALLSTGPMSTPGPPGPLQAVRATGGTVDVCWSPPLDTGGIPITGYLISQQPTGNVVYNGTANPTTCAHIANTPLQVNSTYVFTVVALNYVGAGASTSSGVSTAAAPSLPAELGPPLSVDPGGDTLAIRLSMPGDTGGLPTLYYVLYINTTNTTSSTATTTIYTFYNVSSAGAVTVAGLAAKTTYAIKYTAANALGMSSMSAVFLTATGPATLPSAPLQLRVDPLQSPTGACVPLVWSPPISSGGIPLVSYRVYVATAPPAPPVNNVVIFPWQSASMGTTNTTTTSNTTATALSYALVYTGPAATPSTVVCGLDQLTRYAFQVLAYNDASFCTPTETNMAFSIPVVVSTSNATVPSRLAAPQAASSTGGMIQLVWTAPIDSGGLPILSYQLYQLASNGAMLAGSVNGSTASLALAIYGLDESKTYQFTLTATNAMGTSSASPPLTAYTTAASTPTSPLALIAATVTGGTVTLSWQPPLDAGGRRIVSYYIYRNSLSVGDSNGATTFLDVGNLQATTAYSYSVAAYTAVTYGRPSAIVVVTTGAATLPAVCTNISVVITGGSLSVAWLPPLDTGGLAILSYTSVLTLGAVEVKQTTTPGPQTVFSLLSYTTTYGFSVVATNALGASPATVGRNMTTARVTAPGKPSTPPSLVSVFGGNVTLSLDLPINTGGDPNTLQFIVYKNSGLLQTLPAVTSGTRVTVFGLTASTTYIFSYACVNGFGVGPASDAVAVTTTSPSTPGMMTPLTVVATASRAISFVWVAPIDTGGNTNLTYAVDVSGTTFYFTGLQGTATGLAAATTYTVRIKAGTAVVGGQFCPWSSGISVTTDPAAAGVFSFGAASFSVLKNASQFLLPVNRRHGSVGTVTVTLTTSTASLLGTQFILDPSAPSASSRVLTFADGVVQMGVNLGVLNDRVYTSTGVPVGLQLTSPTNDAILDTVLSTSSTLLLLDAGAAGQISFARSTASVLKSAATLVLPLVRTGGASSAVEVLGRAVANADSAVPNAALGGDFRIPTTPVEFADGQTSASLTLVIRNNNMYEWPQTAFSIQLVMFAGGAVIGPIGTITVALVDAGAVSPPLPPPVPTVLAVTGGAINLQLLEPINRGSQTARIAFFKITIAGLPTPQIVANTGASVWVGGGLVTNRNYQLSVQAANDVIVPTKYGTASAMLSFTTGAPSMTGPATALKLVKNTGGAMVVAWGAPVDGGGVPIQQYNIQWADGQGNVNTSATTVVPNYTIPRLAAMSNYSVKVQCNNGVYNALTGGWGPYSSPVVFFTNSTTLPGPPTLRSTTLPPASGGSITIAWDPPLDTGGQSIVQYTVLMKLANQTSYYKAPYQQPIDLSRSTVLSLYAQTNYQFSVFAVNAAGSRRLPGLFNISSKAATIAASAVVGNVYIQPGASILLGDYYFQVAKIASSTTFTVTIPHAYDSLVNVVAYLIGQPSAGIAQSTTEATLPQAPPLPTFTRITGGAVYGYFLSPLDTGGVPIIGYHVYFTDLSTNVTTEVMTSANAVVTIVAGQPLSRNESFQVNGLLPQHPYTLRAMAINTVSGCTNEIAPIGPAASFSSTAATLPGPPLNLSVALATGAGLSLKWNPPFDTGGVAIAVYTLGWLNPVSQNWTTVYASSTPAYRLAGLNMTTSYQFRLQATSVVGSSSVTPPVTFKTSAMSAPGPCNVPTLVSRTGGMIRVAWSPPADTGGSPINLYLVERDDGAGGAFSLLTTNATTLNIYGLRANTTYRVKVLAHNAVGAGEESPVALLATGPPSRPQPPDAPIITASSGGALTVTMKPPLDTGGVDVNTLFYLIYANGNLILNVTYLQLVAAQATSTTTTSGNRRLDATTGGGLVVSGLDPNKKYKLSSAVSSPLGQSGKSSSKVSSTTTATVPSSPAAPTLVDAKGGSLVVAWTSPVDSGGVPVKNYWLYNAAAPTDPVCVGLLWQCTVPGLLSTTSYSFYVVAENSVGMSPASATLTATTTSVKTPGAPQSLTLVSLAASGTAATLRWTTPLDTGGLGVASYTCTATKVSDQSTSTTSFTTTTGTVSPLTANTAYTVTCVAVNAAQVSSVASTSVTFTTPTGTGAPIAPVAACVGSTLLSVVWPPIAEAVTYTLYRNNVAIYTGQTPAFTDESLTAATAYNYAVTYTTASQVESTRVSATLATDSTTTPTCTTDMGYITQGQYTNSFSKSWIIAPSTSAYTGILVTFTRFEIECDHDSVKIEQFPFNGQSVLWSGGCTRDRTFTLYSMAANTPLKITLTSDASVQGTGFELTYVVNADVPTTTTAACPQSTEHGICSNQGACMSSGQCSCNLGFTGEDCSNYIVCCNDPAVCRDPVCDYLSRVILVSTNSGDDVQGTGQLVGATDVGGVTAKPYATLSKALSMATATSVIVLYPGTYSDPTKDCGLSIQNAQVDLRGFQGSSYVVLNCSVSGTTISQSSVSIQGISVQGITTSGSGGAFSVTRSNVTFDDIQVGDVTAGQKGGAIFADQSQVSLTNSILASNAADQGGAIYARDSYLALNLTAIMYNNANQGGGIYATGSTTITNVDVAVTNNNAVDCGGGVALSGTVVVWGADIEANTAAVGGGLCVDGQISFHGGAFVDSNSASESGGGFYSRAPLVLTATDGLTISNNLAGDSGGGFFVDHVACSLTSSDTSVAFVSNVAQNHGGGLFLNGSAPATLQGLTWSTNVAIVGRGGGVAVSATQVTARDSSVVGNTAIMGGGVSAQTSSTIALINVDVSTNGAAQGGGLFVDASALTGGNVHDNSATAAGGCVGLANASLSNAAVTSCASSGHGGGIYVAPSSRNLVTNVLVTQSSSQMHGGGLHAENTTLSLANVSFQNNAAGLGGGGVSLTNTVVSGLVQIDGCTASTSGGGLRLAGTIGLDAVTVTASSAPLGGGFAAHMATFVIWNATIAGNQASSHGGGGYIEHSQGSCVQFAVTGNEAVLNGGGLYLAASAVLHSGVSMTQCVCHGAGGGLYLNASTFLPKTASDVSVLTANTAYQGGHVGLTGQAPQVHNFVASGGVAAFGGGLFASAATACSIQSASITANVALNYGGGVAMQSSTMCTMTNVSLQRNGATYGGGFALQDTTLQHSSLVVAYNHAPSAGGIYFLGRSNLLLSTSSRFSTVTNNYVCATGQCGDGANLGVAGLANASASGLYLRNGVADLGGSVYIAFRGAVTLTNCTLENNFAASGGAVCADQSTSATFVNCLFQNNTAVAGGGAILLPHTATLDSVSYVQVTQCTFLGNVVQHGHGGAVYFNWVQLVGSNVRFLGNTANGNGGAMYLIGTTQAQFGVAQLTNNSISANNNGGAIYVVGASTLLLADSTVVAATTTNALSPSEGGLIYVQDAGTTLQLTRSILQNGLANFGGAIFSSNARVVLVDSIVTACNSVEFGGALYLTSFSTTTLINSTLSYNYAAYDGGAVFAESSSTFTATASSVVHNTADGTGGGIYLDIGTGNLCTLTNCSISGNTASGLGSALYASRDSTTSVFSSVFDSNGGLTIYGYSEGGPVYFVDSFGTFTATTFSNNIAQAGGAVQVYSAASQVSFFGCAFVANTATTDGGALYHSNGTVTVVNSTFVGNQAASTGGAVSMVDSSMSQWVNVTLSGNSAASGGGLYMTDQTTLRFGGGRLLANAATYGGGVYVTLAATLTVHGVLSDSNVAALSGGAFYLNETAKTAHTALIFANNSAPVGFDVFWRYGDTSPVYTCASCTFGNTSWASLSTDPIQIQLGWWPPYTTSGVFMSAAPSDMNSTTLLWDTSKAVPWPTVVIVDFYGHRSVLDTETECRVYKKASEKVYIVFMPDTQVFSTAGFVSFMYAQVQSDANDEPFHMTAACTLYNQRTRSIDFQITVQPCAPGYMLQSQLCVQCADGTFSLDGRTCHACPMGALCSNTQVSAAGGQVSHGVAFPSTQQGYFLAEAPPTLIQKQCDDAKYFPKGDPCPGGTEEDRLHRIRACMNSSSFGTYWDESRVFTCTSGYFFYNCPVEAACASSLSIDNVSTSGFDCNHGYTSPLCASCAKNFQKLDDGTCVLCDDTSIRAFYGYVTIPVLLLLAAIVAVALYLHKGTDAALMAQARAAARDETFVPPEPKPPTASWAKIIGGYLRPVRQMIKKVSLRKGKKGKYKTPPNLFGIKQMALPPVTVSPEKFKILLAFFQIFTNFKDTYQIQWPSRIASFMAFFAKFNFSFVSIPHLDCIVQYTFYGDFRLTLLAAACLFLLLHVAFRWGVFVYKRKLHEIPRHCTKCGLPNVEILKIDSDAQTKRYAMEIENDETKSRLQKFVAKIILKMEKQETKGALPIYAKNHSKCPTSQLIDDESLRQKLIQTNLRLWQARSKLRLNFKTYFDKTMKIFFWMALLMYPAISQKVLSVFNCVDVAHSSYLVSDMTLVCHDKLWVIHAVCAGIGMVFWVIGVPVYCFAVLLRERMAGVRQRMKIITDGKHEVLRQKWIELMKVDYKASGIYWNKRFDTFADMLLREYMKKRNMELPGTVARVGFIYAAYKDTFWYFEIVDLIRKLFMNGLVAFFGRGTVTQIVVGMMIIFAYMTIILALQPYKSQSNTVVAALAQLQLFVSLFAGLMVKMNVGKAQTMDMTVITIIILTINIGGLSYFAIEIIREKYVERKRYKMARMRKYQREVRHKVHQLWIRAMTYAATDAFLRRNDNNLDGELASFRVLLELARRQKMKTMTPIAPIEDTQDVDVRPAQPTA
ncbi:Aste57867_17666 [Aphanomyces stellatus]|uniref:Aste57867_17666 protein n=1 Tax=Aphanomyces stellatus TaxID=120398 RepID=A0A485LBW7_9STRA|nr:hypothetical protein As57867_017605 [Aphanomyces stellatus]VFT94417.1 Aste57867_17666 [Aphanomyces stellatus]